MTLYPEVLQKAHAEMDAVIGNEALPTFADEIETLQTNLEGLKELEQSLKDFNEGFASYMYAMKMNAFVTEWSQVCYIIVHIYHCIHRSCLRSPRKLRSN